MTQHEPKGRFMKDGLLRLHGKFETLIASLILVQLMAVVLLATVGFAFVLMIKLWDQFRDFNSESFMSAELHVVFSGFLAILLGLELLTTVKVYLTDGVIHVEAVLVVALIAIGRHIIELDFDTAEWQSLLGIAALVIALGVGYFAVKKVPPAVD